MLWIVSCKIVDTYFRSDHKPIETIIQTSSQVCTNILLKRNFKKTDTYTIIADTKWLQTPVQELATAQDIDNYTDYIVGFAQELISQTVLYRTLSTQAQTWWTPKVSEAITTEHRVYRQ
jgi:hypothetical protein